MIHAISSSKWFHLFKKGFSSLQSPISHAIADLTIAKNASRFHISAGGTLISQLPGHATTSRNPKPPQRLVEFLSRLGPLDLNRYPHMCILCTVTHYSRFEIQHHYFAQTTKMDALVYLYTYMSLYTHI